MVETICDLLDDLERPKGGPERRDLITFVKDRPGHDRRYAIDSSKLRQDLDWTPEESLESGIRKTIQWYMDNPEWVAHIRSGEYQSWMEEHYG